MLRRMWASALWLLLLIAANSIYAQTPSPALLVLEKSDKTMAIVDPITFFFFL